MIFSILIFIIMTASLIIMEKWVKYESLVNPVKYFIRSAMICPLLLVVLLSGWSIYSLLIFSALCGAIFADIMIIHNTKIGAIMFAIVHGLIIAAFITVNTHFTIENIALWICCYGLFTMIYIKIFPLTIETFMFFAYLLLVSFEFFRGIAVIDVKFIAGLVAAAGSFLFLACDYEVGYLEFKGKFLGYQQLNHALYYGGLLLLALSTNLMR